MTTQHDKPKRCQCGLWEFLLAAALSGVALSYCGQRAYRELETWAASKYYDTDAAGIAFYSPAPGWLFLSDEEKVKQDPTR